MIVLLGALASAEEPAPADIAPTRPVGVLRELDHPVYVDEAGTLLPWVDVRALAAPTDALAHVRRRRTGRTALKVGFAAATALEAWGTYELARQESLVAIPLGVQAGFTGLCEVLLWTRIPEDRRRDRAIVLDAANARLRTLPR
ncbi:MAG: hypothetical protein H6735_10350 [Alphaproteobacteria bacterium]|nr:hypothetical protein [Alphaproteobacteria bacterium]